MTTQTPWSRWMTWHSTPSTTPSTQASPMTPKATQVPVNGEYTLSQLLDFWSGYDPEEGVLDGYIDLGLGSAPVYVFERPMIHVNDLVRALVAEVRRLRALDPVSDPSEEGK